MYIYAREEPTCISNWCSRLWRAYWFTRWLIYISLQLQRVVYTYISDYSYTEYTFGGVISFFRAAVHYDRRSRWRDVRKKERERGRERETILYDCGWCVNKHVIAIYDSLIAISRRGTHASFWDTRAHARLLWFRPWLRKTAVFFVVFVCQEISDVERVKERKMWETELTLFMNRI